MPSLVRSQSRYFKLEVPNGLIKILPNFQEFLFLNHSRDVSDQVIHMLFLEELASPS